MAVQPISVPAVREHTYHAQAHIFEASLEQPFPEKVRPHAFVKLNGESHYYFNYAPPYRLEGVLSYESGYTQVAGHQSSKPGHGFATLTTSVIEGLNILEVLTADRVVAQISTEHPLDGAVPEVSFLGTRFENLRIAGHKLEIDTNLDILGPKPDNDESYFDQEEVRNTISQQSQKLSMAPDWARTRPSSNGSGPKPSNQFDTSLVSGVRNYPGSFGHVFEIPHFGKFFLGELTVTRKKAPLPEKGSTYREYDTYRFMLTMIRMELGCPVVGSGGVGTADSNGQGSNGNGKPTPVG